MKIGQFLRSFRENIGKKNKRKISVNTLASILNVKPDIIRSCEKGYQPRSEDDRNKIKSYFFIDNLEEIPEESLFLAIKKFNPHEELSKSHKMANEQVIYKINSRNDNKNDVNFLNILDDKKNEYFIVNELLKNQDKLISMLESDRNMLRQLIDNNRKLTDAILNLSICEHAEKGGIN